MPKTRGRPVGGTPPKAPHVLKDGSGREVARLKGGHATPDNIVYLGKVYVRGTDGSYVVRPPKEEAAALAVAPVSPAAPKPATVPPAPPQSNA